MSSMLPVALYGLKVQAGDVMVPAAVDFPATFHITMAAIDPSTPAEQGISNGHVPQRATLKLIFEPTSPGAEEDESDDDSYLDALLGGASGDKDEDGNEDSSENDEETNGGPSDPSKTKKARRDAAAAAMIKALEEEKGGSDSDEEMRDSPSSKMVNGASSVDKKGKGKAVAVGHDSSDEEDEEDAEIQELVLCTLDPNQHCQQPLDITIPEGQNAYFKVSGHYAVCLTGNYVIPPDGSHDDMSEDPEDYDMSPDEDELGEEYEEDAESDELDDLGDPRITELESDDEAPKLTPNGKVVQSAQKGKNKRAAPDSDDESATLDAIMDKSLKPADKPAEPAAAGATEPKLSKKQLKKLKNNAGKAVDAAMETKKVVKEEDLGSPKAGRKVQFAEDLEQGPSKKTKEIKTETKEDVKPIKQEKEEKAKPILGQKTLQDGVKVDDRKLGTGPVAKKGDKVSMRYIGKLADGKVFDANKKGAPFRFTIGAGEVIKGWDIGIQGMSVGGERRIDVPAKMAYGSQAKPGIPSNSPLKFDVKMLSIN